jgi:CBS domain-containing protein
MRSIETEVGTLPVCVRELAGGERPSLVTSYVHCPDAQDTRGVDACVSCPRFDGLRGGEGGAGLSLRCKAAALPVKAADPRRAHVVDLRTPVDEVMDRDVTCVRGDLHVRELKAILLTHDATGFPVTDEAGAPLGFVSREDVLTHLISPVRQAHAKRTSTYHPVLVRDIMTPFTVVLHRGAPVLHAAQLMGYEGINHLPVVDAHNHIMGMMTTLVLTRWLAAGDSR